MKFLRDELLKDPKKNVIVRGGDQVIVSENDRFFVALGASETEKLVYFDRENISVVEAMSSLGGLQDLRANPQGVLLLREYPKVGNQAKWAWSGDAVCCLYFQHDNGRRPVRGEEVHDATRRCCYGDRVGAQTGAGGDCAVGFAVCDQQYHKLIQLS